MDTSDSGMDLIEELADDFAERHRRGETPGIEEYAERYPDLAGEIREVFPALAMIEKVSPKSRDLKHSDGSLEVPDPEMRELGDYRILREIGRGGMGVVYEAVQQSLGRRVALKVLPREFTSTEHRLRRFEREARAAARMHHTNIVPVFEVGHEQETAYYAMQLIRGQGLDLVIGDLQRLRTETVRESQLDRLAEVDDEASLAASMISGRFHQEQFADAQSNEQDVSVDATKTYVDALEPSSSAVLPGQSDISTAESNRRAYFRSVAQIGIQTAGALAYAHARGIIHRDIKPSNLLLDAAGVTWVTDFGLAKTNDDAMTNTGDIVGTVRYMSPERFRGECDQRADIYSLGLTLYELLVLRPAFKSSDRLKVIEMVNKTEPVAPRRLDARIPRDFETIVLKSIDKDPRRRYQTADELSDDLERFLRDEPIRARPISSLERLMRWSRRNSTLAASLATVAALLLLLSLGSAIAATSLYQQREQLRNLAAEKEIEARRAVEARKDAEKAAQRNLGLAYASNLQSADTTWNSPDGRIDQVEQFLTPWIPTGPDQPDLREFSWRYQWSQLNQSALATVTDCSAASLSEEADLLAADKEGIWLTNLNRQKLFWRGDASDAIFSGDGRWVAIPRESDLHVAILDMEVGKVVRHLPGTRASFSNNGTFIATWGDEDPIRVSNTETGSAVAKFARAGLPEVISPAYFHLSPNGTSFLFRNRVTNKVSLFDDGQDPRIVFDRYGRSCCWSADGRMFALAEIGGEVHIVSVAESAKIETFKTISDVPTCMRFSSDSTKLFIGGVDGRVDIRDTSSLVSDDLSGNSVPLQTSMVKAHAQPIRSLWPSKDGKSLVTLDDAGTARLWDLERTTDSRVLTANSNNRVASGSIDTEILEAGRSLAPRAGYRGLIYSPKGSQIIGNRRENTRPDRWQLSESVEEEWLPPSETMGSCVALSADGQYFAMDASADVQIWDLAARKLVTTWPLGLELASMAFSPSGKYLAVGTGSPEHGGREHSSVFIWDVVEQRQITIPFQQFQFPVGGVAFTSNGGLLVATSRNGKTRTWNTATWTLKQNHTTISNRSLAASPDQRTLATGHHDGTITIWDAEKGTKTDVLAGEATSVNALAFSLDGRTLAAGMDHKIVLWDITTGMPTQRLQGHSDNIVDLEFSPNGEALASASLDGSVRLWEAASFEAIDSHPLTVRSLVRLGRIQNKKNDLESAERTLRHALQIQQGEVSRWVTQTRLHLSESLTRQGRHEAAAGNADRRSRTATGRTVDRKQARRSVVLS